MSHLIVAIALSLQLGGGGAALEPTQSAAPARGTAAPEVADLANGWMLLAQGQIDQAAARAAQVLAVAPRNGSALLLAIEADLMRGGALRGVAAYEQWLGQRTIEEPAALRRLSTATLREEAAQEQDAGARIEALRALSDDGDRAAAEQLSRIEEDSSPMTVRALASVGNEAAIKKLLAERHDSSAAMVTAIDALGASGSRLAVPTLVEHLKDARMEVRGSAATALGHIGGSQAAAALKPLLEDRSLFVRARAAGALFRQGDDSGMPVLQQLLADQSPASRLIAADAMSTKPDAAWLALVKDLAASPDAETRASAAGLLLPHDPDMAGRVLDSLMSDPNPAIRDLAAQVSGGGAPTINNLTMLRRLLKAPARRTKVRAAARLLTLTR